MVYWIAQRCTAVLAVCLLAGVMGCRATDPGEPQTPVSPQETSVSQPPETETKTKTETSSPGIVESPSSAPPDNSTDNTLDDEPFDLIPGHYCYSLKNDILTTNLRFDFDQNNQISGDARSTIHNEEAAYYTSYNQKFSGTLTGSDAAVDITTWIEYDVQESQETWRLTRDELKMERDTLAIADCRDVEPVFQSRDGLDAKALLDGITIARDQRVEFARGESGATVSNSVIRGERDVYQLGASGGQKMTLAIDALENNAVFDVISDSGYILAREATEETILLPHSGGYTIIVGGTRGNASYDLTIGIE